MLHFWIIVWVWLWPCQKGKNRKPTIRFWDFVENFNLTLFTLILRRAIKSDSLFFDIFVQGGYVLLKGVREPERFVNVLGHFSNVLYPIWKRHHSIKRLRNDRERQRRRMTATRLYPLSPWVNDEVLDVLKVTLTFEYVDQIQRCDHSNNWNENSLTEYFHMKPFAIHLFQKEILWNICFCHICEWEG